MPLLDEPSMSYIPHSHYRLYVPWLEALLGGRIASQDASYLHDLVYP